MTHEDECLAFRNAACRKEIVASPGHSATLRVRGDIMRWVCEHGGEYPREWYLDDGLYVQVCEELEQLAAWADRPFVEVVAGTRHGVKLIGVSLYPECRRG